MSVLSEMITFDAQKRCHYGKMHTLRQETLVPRSLCWASVST